jgi:LIVCS family branched-chain amino acid:cation transporter
MSRILKLDVLSTGFAMFSMFFGAGNIIFPLVVGQYAGSHNLFAIMGLILTAVVMPFAGVIAMILYDGDYRKFFGRIGRIPGFILALVILSLLGPLGSVPRCIALSYSTLKTSFPDLSSIWFCAGACMLVFLLSVKKSRIIDLLGKYLTPVLIITLFVIIIKGLLTPIDAGQIQQLNENLFLYGLKEGYQTMDLMAAFFFSSAIITILKSQSEQKNGNKNYLTLTLQASVIGAILLSLVYIGFSYIASFHAQALNITGNDQLLSALTIKIAGPAAGLLACVTISLACLTTAIALSSVFSDFIKKEVLMDKVSYAWVLAFSLLITFFVSTFEFNGISAFLGPILEVCYPCLIILTIVNLGTRIVSYAQGRVPAEAIGGKDKL